MIYRIKIQPVSSGTKVSASPLIVGVTHSEGAPHEVVVNASSAQIQGIMHYIAHINAGDSTTAVESAVAGL